MLGSRLVSLGPFSLPVWAIAAAGGVVLAAVLQRTVWRDRRSLWRATNDALAGGALAGFLAWKLVPLLVRFDEIREAPLRLLYYPGGNVGLAVGVVAGLAVAAYTLARSVRGEQPAAPALAGHALVPVMLAGLAVVAVQAIPVASSGLPTIHETGFLDGHAARFDPAAPTVVVAWATWCGPCTAQMPEVDRFHRDHGGTVNVLALNLTATEDSPDAVAAYLREGGLEIPVLLDRDGTLQAQLRVGSTPTSIVFDSGGNERSRRTGAVNADWFARRLLPLVR